MKIKLSAHGAYHHQYHVVWIPKYRKKVGGVSNVDIDENNTL
jgi:hypothetical protein